MSGTVAIIALISVTCAGVVAALKARQENYQGIDKRS